MISLHITNGKNIHVEKRFSTSQTVDSLKLRLESICGYSSCDMLLQLSTPTSSIPTLLIDENKTLADYCCKEHDTITITNTNPFAQPVDYFSESNLDSVKKFELSPEQYQQRNDSFFTWKRSHLNTAKRESNANNKCTFDVGSRCTVLANDFPRRGTVKWIGCLAGKENEGLFVGVELDEPLGTHEGTFNGIKYFDARRQCGTFVRASLVQPSSFSSLSDNQPSIDMTEDEFIEI